MNPMQHELLVELLRKSPDLVAMLLELAGVLPEAEAVSLETLPGDLSDTRPAQLRADHVVVMRSAGRTRAAVIEVQLHVDAAKRWVWPAYPALVFRSLRMECALIVLAPDPKVAAWARRAIHVGPGHSCIPVVVGPDDVPLVSDPRQPLGVLALSALAHGRREVEVALPIVRAFLGRLEDDPDTAFRATLYDVVVSALSDRLSEEVRKMIANYEFQLPELRQQITEARAKAITEGRAEGRAEGHREALLRQLSAKFGAVDDATRERVRACSDVAVLESWAVCLLTAGTVDEVFAG